MSKVVGSCSRVFHIGIQIASKQMIFYVKHRFWTSVFPEKLKKECNSYLGKINCENYEDRERCSDKHAELGERFKMTCESHKSVLVQV